MSLLEAATTKIEPVTTPRPLGIITAWLGYKITGGIWLQQIINYIGAIAGWSILFFASGRKRYFAYVAFVVGGAFFSGYIYLFHLHGVFYSPLLILIAIILKFASHIGKQSNKVLFALLTFTFIVGLFHPFAFLVFLAFLAGYLIENIYAMRTKEVMVTCLIIGINIVSMIVLGKGADLTLTSNTVRGFITSYKMVEVNSILAVLSWLLCIATIMCMQISRLNKVVIAIIVTATSVVFVLMRLPIILIWITLCILNASMIKKWGLVFVIIACTAFPLITATGSPTYTVFTIMACAYIMIAELDFTERFAKLSDKIAISSIASIVLILLLLRLGFQLPIISKLANPLLAEKEKTSQLEQSIDWMIKSDLKHNRMMFHQSADWPVFSNNAIERKHRPPTTQGEFDRYMTRLMGHEYMDASDTLLLTFGNEQVDNADIVYRIDGKYNGAATVYEIDGELPRPQSGSSSTSKQL